MNKKVILSTLLLLSISATSCNLSDISGDINDDNVDNSFDGLGADTNQGKTKADEIGLEKIYFKESNIKALIGVKTKLDVVFVPENATHKELDFVISDTSYGTISSDGYLTATKQGSFKVTAYGPYGVTAVCNVTSGTGSIETISADSKIDLDLNNEKEKKITYKVYPDGAFQNIKTSIKDENIASIISDKVVASQTGITELTIYNDENNNDKYDNNELFTSVDIFVHDYSEISNMVPATHELDGLINYDCKCGCGNTKTEVIPALGHDLSEGEIISEPTCTLSGTIRKKCIDPTCDYTNDETIPALGHDATSQIIKDDNIAKLGNYLNKTQYYYTCSRCNELTDKTFGYGHHDYFYNEAVPSFFNDEQKSNNYRTGLVKTINRFEALKNTSLVNNTITVTYKGLYLSLGTCISLVQLGASTNGTYPWVHSNDGNWSYDGSKSSHVTKLCVNSAGGHDNAKKRNEDMVYFDELHKQIDPLIRKDATDVEKALIISLFTTKFITYKYIYYFYTTVKTGEGLCHCYAYMICHLAHRYNLPVIYDYSKNHAWNNVCIDGTWYLLDATWSDPSNLYNLDYFLREWGPSDNHKVNNISTLVKKDTKPLRDKLIQIYKDGELNGVYYNMDTALKTITDGNANYKLILGIGTDGIRGLTPYNAYYTSEYETNVESVNCKSLTITKCKSYTNDDKVLSLKGPASLINQRNITYSSSVKAVAK